jgi:hypothetical protein
LPEINKPDYTYLWSSGGAIVAPSNVKVQTGWTAEVPPFQWENWSQNRQDTAIAHILQKGISVWSATGEYYFTTSGERSYVQGSDGNIYVAVADSVGQNPVTDATDTYWKVAFIDAISLAAAQALNGPTVGSMDNLRTSVTAASTSATFTADSVVVGSALNGVPYKLTSVNKTINLATVGAGGMDTGTAPVSGFVSIYLIYNPTSGASALLACNQTTSSGTVYSGANMPSGYTASALVSAWKTNGSSQLVIGAQIDREIDVALATILNTTSIFTNSPTSIATLAPLAAKEISGIFQCGAASANVNSTVGLASTSSGIGTRSCGGTSVVAAAVTQCSYSGLMLVTPQTVFFTSTVGSGSLSQATAYMSSYKI